MIKYSAVLLLVFIFLFNNVKAQSTVDSTLLKTEFSSMDEALKNPENVYRLNLSNQKIKLSDTIWSKFTNLEYLSFKNDHLKQIPSGVGNLKSLKVLDLSGNDFEVLPSTFSNLTSLEELFINDDKYFKFERNIPVLSELPNLKSLHLEHDGLKTLPESTFKLDHLESLYLNDNEFEKLPEFQGLKNLKYIDFHNNKYKMPARDVIKKESGIKIRF